MLKIFKGVACLYPPTSSKKVASILATPTVGGNSSALFRLGSVLCFKFNQDMEFLGENSSFLFKFLYF